MLRGVARSFSERVSEMCVVCVRLRGSIVYNHEWIRIAEELRRGILFRDRFWESG